MDKTNQAIEIIEKIAVGPILKILLQGEYKIIPKEDYILAYT